MGIPTLRARVLQRVVKNALEPRFEAAFEALSYGFRPGRCCQDAIEEVYVALNNGALGRHCSILDADISTAPVTRSATPSSCTASARCPGGS